ncbi:MAG TPA: hypothetical protein VNN22_21870 [Verrucomicrobiae bacterium]|nr:hypothetical protein [Verrucomicrobiae bacterium]
MKRQLPFASTTLRMLPGPVALVCALTNFPRWASAHEDARPTQ